MAKLGDSTGGPRGAQQIKPPVGAESRAKDPFEKVKPSAGQLPLQPSPPAERTGGVRRNPLDVYLSGEEIPAGLKEEVLSRMVVLLAARRQTP